MAAPTIPTTDPATDYYRRLSPGRIILVANSDVPWSVRLTRRYAKRKRIPYANIISVPMGAQSQWMNGKDWNVTTSGATLTTDNVKTLLLDPVAALHDALQAQGVFMGPGTPQRVRITGQWDGAEWQPTAVNWVPLANLVPCARWFIRQYVAIPSGSLGWFDSGGFSGFWPGTSDFYFPNAVLWWPEPLTGVDGPVSPTYGTTYAGLGNPTESYQIPNKTALDLLGDSGNKSVLQGRIGMGWTSLAYGSTGEPSIFETEEMASDIIETALNYGEGLNPDNRYQHVVHFPMSRATSLNAETMAWLADQMRDWGYTVNWAYLDPPTAEMETYAPAAESVYSKAKLDAGLVRQRYHLLVGDMQENGQMIREPRKSSYIPSPGAGSYLGPSEAWKYCAHYLTIEDSAGGGASNQYHISSLINGTGVQMVLNLLRGMSWAEAIYYSGYSQHGEVFAIGDPLLTPFPRRFTA